jgi:adenine-specific DNA-methyltransferase
MNSSNYDKLKKLLRELFQFDQADLDFGIYRIMNQKREEIEQFLENDLLPQVKDALGKYQPAEKVEVKNELDEMIKSATNLGMDPEENNKVRELRAKYEKSGDLEAVESEIYSDLYHFFNRYYDKGDFISKRRYKEGVYAIPYEGEEVKLHWANADQYYIKTSEYFNDYTFKLPKSEKRVHFKIVEASTEKDNNKEQSGEERYFVIANEDIYEENNELFIPFEYRTVDGKVKQDKLNEETVEKVFATEGLGGWIEELKTPESTEKNKNRTLLEKQLNKYSARNKFDYFIHKDLGGFLRRELDFYIKNEIMHLDDLNTENELHFQQYLSKVKVQKEIGRKIIAFLEQIENFQKKLWLKKKFVVETNYCVTLDHVPEELYPEIIKNEAQIEEWKQLFAINEIEPSTINAGYSEPLTKGFLLANPYLVLDTKFFDESFKENLIADSEELDQYLDGLMIHSENFQALKLIQERYKNSIRTVYIDPPYNTVHSEILYKNQFKHSSWLALIANVATLSQTFLERTFSYGIAIDDYEYVNLAALYDSLFPNFEREVAVINHHPQGAGGRLSRTHEYFIIYSPGDAPAYLGKPLENYQEDRSFMRSGTANNNFRIGRWKSFYALIVDPKTKKIIDAEAPVPLGEEYPITNTSKGYIRVYPINKNGEERVWRSSYITGKKRAENGELTLSDKGTAYQRIDHESKRETLFSNWTDSKFNAGIYGSNLLRDMGLGGLFDYPKSINTVETALWAQSFGDNQAIILDYFAGSGTTGHAVINQNREKNGNRKYILVEMGDHFDTVMKPRIQKVIYSKDWKHGKPVSREGSSHMFKYIRLESYEDTLNNLSIKRDKVQQELLDEHGQLREQYMLSYMLNKETEGSPSLLNIDLFKDPFDYRLMITNNGESQETRVDLVETFNYLIGIHVIRYGRKEHFKAIPNDKSEVPGAVKLRRASDEGDITFQEIEGRTNDGEKVLVIWRTDPIKNNAALDAFFSKRDYNTLDFEFDRIYVNGDNNLENLKKEQDQWKVNLIEQEFQQRMFDVQDV